MIKETIKKDHFELVSYQSAKNGMPYCGDDYFFTYTDEYFICVLADGLGSGQLAYESSNAVTREVKEHHSKGVETLMNISNRALINKRGATVSVLKVYYDTKEFVYSSVGNIQFFFNNPGSDQLVYPLPVTGYLSGRKQKYHTQRFKYEPGSSFMLFSDGVKLQGTKTLLKSSACLEYKAQKIIEENNAQADDMTFIIGSLLS
jgi:phosphoserine phosphatase RsbX